MDAVRRRAWLVVVCALLAAVCAVVLAPVAFSSAPASPFLTERHSDHRELLVTSRQLREVRASTGGTPRP